VDNFFNPLSSFSTGGIAISQAMQQIWQPTPDFIAADQGEHDHVVGLPW